MSRNPCPARFHRSSPSSRPRADHEPLPQPSLEPCDNPLGHAQRGFTLIEVMVVIVILGIMAALVVPNLAGRQDQAQVTAALSDLRALGNALEMYKLDNFHYPSTEQGLEALVERPGGFPEAKNWKSGGYVRKLPEDPWGNPYRYIATDRGFELYSLGADGQEGGEGFAADLSHDDT